MANKLYEEADIQAAADAIREKNGLSQTYKVSEFADAIRAIATEGGSIKVYTTSVMLDAKASEISITHNLGTMDILMCAAYLDEDCADSLEHSNVISSVYIQSPFSSKTSSSSATYDNIRNVKYWYISSSTGSGYQNNYTSPINVPTITDENNVTIQTGSASYLFPAGIKIGIIIVAV